MEFEKQVKKKRLRRRRFQGGEVHHIYQRTIKRYNIFYDLEDYLVYYTIFSVAARKSEVSVLGLCLMFDHIHMLVKAQVQAHMSEFVRLVTSMFVREQNTDVGRKGALFRARFGSAPKKGMKLLRTSIAYLLNNPVEKKLCKRAEEFRWNFLAYAVSDHPYSDPIVKKEVSRYMRKALREVDAAEAEGRHLRYGQLRRMFGKLDYKESQQLLDHIVSIYNVVDYDALIGCYGSYQDMLTAVNSNTGSEYDIKEDRYRFSDVEYLRMGEVLRHKEGVKTLLKVTMADIDEKLRLFNVLSKQLSCAALPICKFLHLDVRFE